MPAALEFTPGIVDLAEALRTVEGHAGDGDAIEEALRARYFGESAERQTDPAKRRQNQLTRAYNLLLGMRHYGLVSDEYKLTDLGVSLLAEGDPDTRHELFASHILRERHGNAVLQAVRSLQRRGEDVDKDSLQEELRRIGFELPRMAANHTRLLQWLRLADVLPERGYTIDEERAASLGGLRAEDVRDWSRLDRQQKAFVESVARLSGGVERQLDVEAVLDDMQRSRGIRARSDWRRKVVEKLQTDGWIETPAHEGRGSRSGTVLATSKLLEADLAALISLPSLGIPADLQERLDTTLDEIRAMLGAKDTGVKGLGLELLALRMALDLGLAPIGFRERSDRTGGAEVDLLAEGLHLHFSRWLFQCKNVQNQVPLSALAKEVGMATLMHGHVVVLATTSTFAGTVIKYANEVSASTHIQVVLVDGRVVSSYLDRGSAALTDHFHSTAGEVMQLKRPQVKEAMEAAADEA